MKISLFVKGICAILILISYSQSQVYKLDKGKIEFIGLNNWDGQTLLDTLSTIAPNKPIRACAADLKTKLNFADASVVVYLSDDYTPYTVVTVVEPELCERIKYKETPPDELPTIKEWKVGAEILKHDPSIIHASIITYGKILAGNKDSATVLLSKMQIEKSAMEPFWLFLQKHSSKLDRDLALWCLENDGNPTNRKLSILILLNFADSDIVWWKLLDIQRVSDARISSLAILALRTMSKELKRKVNWQPAENIIKYILNGTNPFAFLTTLNVLSSTEISKDLKESILRDSSDLLLAYLRAKHSQSRQSAINFVSQISGGKIKNAEELIAWLNSTN